MQEGETRPIEWTEEWILVRAEGIEKDGVAIMSGHSGDTHLALFEDVSAAFASCEGKFATRWADKNVVTFERTDMSYATPTDLIAAFARVRIPRNIDLIILVDGMKATRVWPTGITTSSPLVAPV
jgi:hypothetical protein